MTPEQFEIFLAAMKSLLLAASDGVEMDDGKTVQLRDSEFHSGARLIWMGKESNGYVNLSHEEALSLCGTSAKSTLRYHLMRLRDAGVLRMYSTNGTVRVKVTGYPGSEMIIHERARTVSEKTLTASTNSRTVSTNSRTGSTCCEKDDTERERGSRDRAAGQLLRAAGSRDRAAGQHYNRNFDDYPNVCDPLVSKLVSNTITETEKITNSLTATTIDPVEEALSVAFLKAAGFFPRTAIELAKKHPFELLRRAVAFWWSNRRSKGGEFAETPGIVLAWLKNQDSTVIPAMSNDFFGSELFWNHLTSAERDDLEREGRNQPEPDMFEEYAIDVDEPANWPAENEIWNQALALLESELPASTYKTWLTSTAAVIDEQSLTCTVCCDNATTRDWLANRLSQMISRTVNAVAQQRYRVQFEVRRRS